MQSASTAGSTTTDGLLKVASAKNIRDKAKSRRERRSLDGRRGCFLLGPSLLGDSSHFKKQRIEAK
jgi:hypothetical protein